MKNTALDNAKNNVQTLPQKAALDNAKNNVQSLPVRMRAQEENCAVVETTHEAQYRQQ